MAHKSEKTEDSSNVHSVENMITDLKPCFVVLHKLETVGIKVEKDADKNCSIGDFSLSSVSETIKIENEIDNSSPTCLVDQIVKDEAETGFANFMEVDFRSVSVDDHFRDRVVDFKSEGGDMNECCTNDTESVKEGHTVETTCLFDQRELANAKSGLFKNDENSYEVVRETITIADGSLQGKKTFGDEQMEIESNLPGDERMSHTVDEKNESAFGRCENLKCLICSTQFLDDVDLQRHLPIHKANELARYYKYENYLNADRSNKIQLEYCRKCLMSFNTKTELRKHKWEKHGHEIKSPYCCGECYTVFSKKMSVKYHLRENGHEIILQRKKGVSTNKFPTSPETVEIIDSCTPDISVQHETKVVPHVLVTPDCINIQNIIYNEPEMIKENENQGLNSSLNKSCVYQEKNDSIKEVDRKISEKDFMEEIVNKKEGCYSQESLSSMEVENINQNQFSRGNSDSRKKSVPATENIVSGKSSEMNENWTFIKGKHLERTVLNDKETSEEINLTNETDTIHSVLEQSGASVIRSLQHQERPTCGSNRNSFNKETIQSKEGHINNQKGSMENDEVESFDQYHNERRCLICNMPFMDKEKLKTHIVTHDISDLIKYYSHTDEEKKAQNAFNPCSTCFQIFKTEIGVKKHIWEKHRNNKIYCCNDCYHSSVALKTAVNHFEKTGHKRVIKVCKGKTTCIFGQYNPSLKSYFQFDSSDTRCSESISWVTLNPIDKQILSIPITAIDNEVLHTSILPKPEAAVDKQMVHTSILPNPRTAVNEEILHTSILPNPRTAVNEEIHHTTILPIPRTVVDEEILHTSILLNPRTAVNKEILHTNILPIPRTAVNEEILHTSILPKPRTAVNEEILHTSILPKPTTAVDEELFRTSILPNPTTAVDEEILHTSILPKPTTAVNGEIFQTSIVPNPTTAVDEDILYTSLLPKSTTTVHKKIHVIMIKSSVNVNKYLKMKQYSVKGNRKSGNSYKMNSKYLQISTDLKMSGTTSTATQNCTEILKNDDAKSENQNSIDDFTNDQSFQSENNISSKSLRVKKSSRKKRTAVLTAKSSVDIKKSDLHITSEKDINNSTYDSRINSGEKYMCKDEKIRCPSCSFFNHPKLIRYHFWYHHLVDKDEWYSDIEISSLNCKMCKSVKFSDTDSYKRHIRSHILDPECKLIVREGTKGIKFGISTGSANLQQERVTSGSANVQNKTGFFHTDAYCSNLSEADSQTLNTYSCMEKSKSIDTCISTNCHDEVQILSPSVVNQQVHQTLHIDDNDMGFITPFDSNNRNGMSSDVSVSDTTKNNLKSRMKVNFNNISAVQFSQEPVNHSECKYFEKGDKIYVNSQGIQQAIDKDLVLVIDIPTENIPAKKLRHFRCDICGREYTSLGRVDHFLCHVRFFHHGNKNGYCCKMCGKMYTRLGGLTLHLRFKYPKLDVRINGTTISQFCGGGQKDNSGNEHENLNFKTKDRSEDLNSKGKLENLGRKVQNKTKDKSENLNSKHKLENLGRKVHKCSFCNKRFKFKTLCTLHEKEHYFSVSHKSVNGDRIEFGCTECRNTYITQRGLKRHIQLAKHGKNEHVHDSNTGLCHLCGKVSVSKNTLYDHMYKHHPERFPYKCHKCGRPFMNEKKYCVHQGECNLETQLKYIRGYPHCNICDKRFFSRKELLIHLCSGRKDWMCDICGRKFVKLFRLKEHLAKHIGIKNVACPYCNKMFFKKEDMSRHVKSLHQNDAGVLCDKCGKVLAYIQKLIYHKKSCPGNW